MEKIKTAAPAKAKAAKTEIASAAKKSANIIETLVKKEQRYLYTFQTQEPKLLPAKAKQMRQKLRRQLSNFIAPILLVKNAESKAKALTDFNAFYKANFILNDFSIKSLTDSRDSDNASSLGEILKLAQASLTSKAK